MDNLTHSKSKFERAQRPRAQVAGSASEFAGKHIRENKKRIIVRWEALVREKVPESIHQSSLVISNTLSQFLDELVEILESATPVINMISVQGMSKVHGGERAGLYGYYLPQLITEFSLLRQVLVEELRELGSLGFEVWMTIHKVIDSAISLAATEFSRVQSESVQVALKKAEASNRDLEHFAFIAAHDLKSPLATITGYLDLLDDEFGERLGSDGEMFIRVMSEASLRMRNLIDRLLDFARLNSAARPFRPVSIDDVVNAAVQNLAADIQAVDGLVTKDTLPIVNGDFDLLGQLFQNLIANSIKFRSERAFRIHISAKEKDGMWLFSVVDNGIGFDPAERDDIFSLYKTLTRDAKSKGAGIGLATCRKVVELHGGTIWADSTPGIGSTFFFTIPIS
jgi:signal transduction histidine kinase